MAVIITNMDMPKNCFTVENKRFKYCKLYDICEYKDLRRGNIPSDCPLKSTDDMKAEMVDISWNIDMYDDDLDFECMYLSDVLKIIDEYCKGDRDDKN